MGSGNATKRKAPDNISVIGCQFVELDLGVSALLARSESWLAQVSARSKQ